MGGAEPLPAMLLELAEIVGRENAMKVASAAGGTRVYIPLPSRLNNDHRLVACVGRHNAEKIATHFATRGGIHINIPRMGGAYSELRRTVARRVQDLDDEGKSSREIALIVGISQRSVHRHRRKNRENRS